MPELSDLIVKRERGCPNLASGMGCGCLGICHELEDVIRVSDLMDWLASGGQLLGADPGSPAASADPASANPEGER